VQFGSSSAPAQAEMLLNAAGQLGQRGEHLETFFVCCSKAALTSAQYRSPLGRRPYDLRHAAVSLWLNSGVPATEVARRAGHGVAVLLKIYAHCIDGQADAANERIAEALGTGDAEEDPGDEGDGDTEQAS
jgi:hypothetical protein